MRSPWPTPERGKVQLLDRAADNKTESWSDGFCIRSAVLCYFLGRSDNGYVANNRRSVLLEAV